MLRLFVVLSCLSPLVHATQPSCAGAIAGESWRLARFPATVIERMEKLFRSFPASARDVLARSRDPAHRLDPNSVADGFSYGLTNSRGDLAPDVARVVRGAMLSDGVRLVTAPGLVDELRAYYLHLDALIEYMTRVYRGEFLMLRESVTAVHAAADRIGFTGAIVLKVRDEIPSALVTPLGELDIVAVHPGRHAGSGRAFVRLAGDLGLTFVTTQTHGPFTESVWTLGRGLGGDTLPPVDWFAEKWTFGPGPALELWSRVKPPHRHSR